jgi:hypothetical protein
LKATAQAAAADARSLLLPFCITLRPNTLLQAYMLSLLLLLLPLLWRCC